MRKSWIIRKDEKAVSPVIATILMVAITVVLAAVLYVMVTGLLTGPGASKPQVTVASLWQSLVIGVAIGVLGGLYPAWRGTTVSGAELLAGA